MNTTASRGVIGLVAAPVAAASIFASTLGISAVAQAATAVPGVNTRTSGMVLSKEFTSGQKEEHGAPATAIASPVKQEAAPRDSPTKREANELRGESKG